MSIIDSDFLLDQALSWYRENFGENLGEIKKIVEKTENYKKTNPEETALAINYLNISS